jgi:hypothetical protein
MATPSRSVSRPKALAFALAAAVVSTTPAAGRAATLLICRVYDTATPPIRALVVPAGSLFRDTGRSDDPLAAFTGDAWSLRLETVGDTVIPSLRACARTPVRITSDSSVKAVSVNDNRTFVYAGSNLLLDAPEASEEIFGLTGKILDQAP